MVIFFEHSPQAIYNIHADSIQYNQDELAYFTIPSHSRDFIADWAYKEVSYKICPYSSLDVYQPVLVYTQSRCDVHYGHVNNIFTSGS